MVLFQHLTVKLITSSLKPEQARGSMLSCSKGSKPSTSSFLIPFSQEKKKAYYKVSSYCQVGNSKLFSYNAFDRKAIKKTPTKFFKGPLMAPLTAYRWELFALFFIRIYFSVFIEQEQRWDAAWTSVWLDCQCSQARVCMCCD